MKRKLMLVIVMLLTIALMPNVDAKVKLGKYFQAGDKLEVNENIYGTMFFAGEDIKVKEDSNIEGIGFLAAQDISVKGSSEYLFMAADRVTVTNNIKKDVFVAGNEIKFDDVMVGRDTYIAGNVIEFDGEVKRNLNIAGDEVTISGIINGDVNIGASNIVIKDAIINGTLTYNSDATIDIDNKEDINDIDTYSINIKKRTYVDKLVDTGYSYLSILFLAIVISLIAPKIFIKLNKLDVKESLEAIIPGFVVTILVPIISLLLMCIVIGIPLSLLMLLIYGICLFLSKVFVGYQVGKIILDKFKSNKLYVQFSLALGIGIIYLIKLIPRIDGVISLLIAFIGMGLIYKLVKASDKK